MSTDKSPAFRFYARDFLTSEKQQDLSLPQAGAYIRLMSHCWLNESLPDDVATLAKRVGATEAQMRKFWPDISKCFVKGSDGRWRHPRLDEERERQRKYSERQLSNGRRGGRPKQNGDSHSNQSLETHGFVSENETSIKTGSTENPLANANANASGSSLEGGSGGTVRMDLWFQSLVAEYPSHRVTRGARTEHAFVEQILGFPGPPEVAWGTLLANLDANIHSHEWRVKGMIPRLEKYLAEGLWRNALPADAPAGEQLSARTMRMLG